MLERNRVSFFSLSHETILTPSNLMIYKTVLKGTEEDFKVLHLDGGLTTAENKVFMNAGSSFLSCN